MEVLRLVTVSMPARHGQVKSYVRAKADLKVGLYRGKTSTSL
jgi:hypothetical protein